VTAVSDTSLTLVNAQNETLTVTLTSQTQVSVLATQGTGSLSDIAVGDNVRVMGRPNDAGATEAQAVVVLPAGDNVNGKVTAVNGATLSVETRDNTTATIVTDAGTKFTLQGGQTGSLTDVTTGKFVEAYGQTQADGSLLATLVVSDNRPGFGGGPGRPGPGPMPGGPGTQQP